MAITVTTAEERFPGRKLTYYSRTVVDFGAQNDVVVINHAPDVEWVRSVRIFDTAGKQVPIMANFWEVENTTDATTTVKNLVNGAQANMTIVLEVSPAS